MGYSTGLILYNRCLLNLGMTEVVVGTNLASSTGDYKKVLQYINDAIDDMQGQLDFPELISTYSIPIVADTVSYSLPTDIFSNYVKYIHCLDSDTVTNNGYIELTSHDDWLKYSKDNRLKAFTFNNNIVFNRKPSTDNPHLKPSTTVGATSVLAAKNLYVADSSDFNVGDYCTIGVSTPRVEYGTVDSIPDGTTLIMEDDLTYTHTLAQADPVTAFDTFQLIYKKVATTITSTTTTNSISDQYDNLIEYYVRYLFYMNAGEFQLSGAYKKKYDELIKGCKSSLRGTVPRMMHHQSEVNNYLGEW